MSDAEYIGNYKPNHLYVHPGEKGAYATLVAENETIIGEIEVTQRTRIAVSAFYVADNADYGTVKFTKLTFHKTYKWQEKESIKLNQFQLSHIRQFLSLISVLDLKNSAKAKIALDDLELSSFVSLLGSSKGREIIKAVADAPELHDDIYAIRAKRDCLAEFEKLLSSGANESSWQDLFERNSWIFGHGLNYVYLDKVADKLETITTGHTFDQAGKRVDGLLMTRAEVSQFVLVEVKKSDTAILKSDAYRVGCWAPSSELVGAVTQIQKTVFEFARKHFRSRLKSIDGADTNTEVYSIEPRSYLVIGNYQELLGNDDKITSFELYRRNTRSPEILTFDELFERAKCAVENLAKRK